MLCDPCFKSFTKINEKKCLTKFYLLLICGSLRVSIAFFRVMSV